MLKIKGISNEKQLVSKCKTNKDKIKFEKRKQKIDEEAISDGESKKVK